MNKVYVVGGANIDISGSSFEPLKEYNSNPGNIKLTYGGVGRNIAENLANLKENVSFISVFSSDAFGKGMYNDLLNKNIDLSFSKVVDNHSSSIYLAILNEKNDMYLGMSDMKILDELDYKLIDEFIKKINKYDVLVVDTNLTKEIIEYILKKSPCVIAMDPISSIKAVKVKGLFKYINIFKPNKYEAEIFSGYFIKDKETANLNIDYFLKNGVEEIIISLAEDGVILADKNERYWIKHNKVDVINATGGGDSFLSAYIKARLQNKSLLERGKYAIGAAVCTIKCKDTVNSKLCDKMIEEEIKNLNIEEEKLCI